MKLPPDFDIGKVIQDSRDAERAQRFPQVNFDADPPVWHPVLHGSAHGSFELSVVRSDHKHAFISWGWFDERKILICENATSKFERVLPGLMGMYLSIADRAAEYLNLNGTLLPAP